MRREVGERERLVRVDEVEPMVRHAGSIGRGRLGGPDVEPAVDLARVGRDDLGGDALGGERLGEADRQAGLAGRRGAGDDEERWSVTPRRALPRSAYGPA